jgi:hypothetical protein
MHVCRCHQLKDKVSSTHSVQTDTCPPRLALVLHAGIPRPSPPPVQGTIVMASFTKVMRRELTSWLWAWTNWRFPTVGGWFGGDVQAPWVGKY